MPIGAIPTNDPSEGGPPVVSVPAEAPSWMKVRRDRQSQVTEKPVAAVEKPPAAPDENPFSSLGQSPFQPAVENSPKPLTEEPPKAGGLETLADLATAPAVSRSKKKKSSGFSKWVQNHWLVVAIGEQLSKWISRQTAISMSFSLGVHSLVLLMLAFIVIRHANRPDDISLWGTVGDPNEGGEEMKLDTAIPNDEGESAPITLDQVAQTFETLERAMAAGSAPAEATRVGSGGKGNGEGESGSGSSMGVAGLRVPGHAQTKGSFTAWADPRDPVPGKDYFIVIRVSLPKNVKKYRGSDLTGEVIGTDKYKQEIKFKPTDQFPIEDGAIVIRIRVPGAARLVRDNIRIESKLLKEKQEFQIEF